MKLFYFPLFWDYYNSVREVIKGTLDKPLDREISRAFSYTHSKILKHIIWEYSDNDLGQIKNFPFDKKHLIIERLSFMVDGYFQGYLIDERNFGEELQNPVLSNEKVEIDPSIIHLGFFKAPPFFTYIKIPLATEKNPSSQRGDLALIHLVFYLSVLTVSNTPNVWVG